VNRWTQIADALSPTPGRRELPHQLLHWRASVDGTMRLIQAETNDHEHTFLVSLAWVSMLGGFDEATGQADAAVHAYITANSAAWRRPIGG